MTATDGAPPARAGDTARHALGGMIWSGLGLARRASVSSSWSSSSLAT